MGRYVSVINFTDQGIRVIRNTVERADTFCSTAKKMGVEIVDIYWTLGVSDLVIVVDAPNDEVVATLFFSLGSLGNIRAHTMRAFTAEEMSNIVGSIP
ncbi:MAG: GYD domain-containing protein [Gammaproteobacteria bacterium]|nr:GYD domain-containing protein [Gammaproteobacteria bacterium]